MLVGQRRSVVLVGFDGCGACDRVLIWPWEREEESRGRLRKRNSRDKIILKKEYKNIIYIKYSV